ncbi:MAG: hypothetical protein JSW40_03535 [Candidatus Omnitrophota bacterium]|nr:MAG: hypothetical protein JSW40_03535 [Candidatus Omnitrophota bacterium]
MKRRGKPDKYKFVYLFVVSGIILAILGPHKLFAKDEKTYFSKDTNYDIYYQVSKHRVDTVSNVRIVSTILVEGKNFLVIRGGGFIGKEKDGYILFEHIVAILPSNYIKPNVSYTPE